VPRGTAQLVMIDKRMINLSKAEHTAISQQLAPPPSASLAPNKKHVVYCGLGSQWLQTQATSGQCWLGRATKKHINLQSANLAHDI
jgi:hypothetical protein